MLKATHKDYEIMVGLQVVNLMPGQFITGRKAGAEELKLKPSTFRDYLKSLEKMGMINLKPDNKKTVVTVENWDKYQTEDGRIRQQPDNEPTTNRQRPDTNNNINNNNNINKDVYRELEVLWCMPITPMLASAIDDLITDYGHQKVSDGIKICAENVKYTVNYLKAVVRNGSVRKEEKREPGGQNKESTEQPRRKYGRQWTDEEIDAIDPNL